MRLYKRLFPLLFVSAIFFSAVPASAAITFFAKASLPADNGVLTDSAARSIAPPAGMRSGDFVYLIAFVRSPTATLTLSDIAGQSWTVKAQQTVNGQGRVRVFTARFNGTWGANPAIQTDEKTGVALTLAMLIFRSSNSGSTWTVDAPQTSAWFSAPAITPFDVTATGRTAIATNTVTVAAFATADDNSWAIQTGGWSSPGGATQFRNTAGNDTSLSVAYKIRTSPGATGNVTNRQTTNGANAGRWLMETFAEATTGVAKKWHPGHYMLVYTGETAAGRVRKWESIKDEPKIIGGEVRYRWSDLETSQGVYDFSAIEADLNELETRGKRLIIAIEDRKFGSTDPNGIVPPYIQNMGGTNMGIAQTKNGFIARVWEKPIMDRLIALGEALAARFDTETHFEAIHGEESVPGFGTVTPPASYSDLKLRTELTRFGAAMALAWPRTNVVQFFNWLGGGTSAQTAFIQGMDQNNIGFGGPDIFGTAGTALTNGQDAYIGVIGGVDYRGKIPCIHNVQSPELGGSLGDYTPLQIFNVANNTLRCSHVSWIRNTLSDDPAQNWGTGTGTGILWMIRNHSLTHTACPTNYINGCDTH